MHVMTARGRALLRALTILIVLVGLAAVALLLSNGRTSGIQATDGGMDALSIDMDPSAAPANTATSLGSREFCARINENDLLDVDEDSLDALEIDVTATNIPASHPMIAFGYTLNYNEAALTVQSQDPNFLLAAKSGSDLLFPSDLSDPTPDPDDASDLGENQWISAAADFGPYPESSESGSGVLQRLTLSSDAGAAGGVYSLNLSGAGHIDPYTIGGFAPDAINNAAVAIDVECPLTPPSPATTPTPTSTRTPTAAPTASAPPSATAQPADTGAAGGHGGADPVAGGQARPTVLAQALPPAGTPQPEKSEALAGRAAAVALSAAGTAAVFAAWYARRRRAR